MYVSLQIMLKFTFYKYQNWQYIQCMINDNWYIDYQLLKNKYSSWTAVQYYSFITLDNQYVIWSVLAAEVCASAVVMLDTQCSEVVWRVLDTHSIHQFPLHFPSRASPCAITFQLDSTTCYTVLPAHSGCLLNDSPSSTNPNIINPDGLSGEDAAC